VTPLTPTTRAVGQGGLGGRNVGAQVCGLTGRGARQEGRGKTARRGRAAFGWRSRAVCVGWAVGKCVF
jgi:hypothetical protein